MHEISKSQLWFMGLMFEKMQQQAGHHHEIARSGLKKQENRHDDKEDQFPQTGVKINESFYTSEVKMFPLLRLQDWSRIMARHAVSDKNDGEKCHDNRSNGGQ